MITVKDTVHDHIEIDGVAADLLDTPAVQRLRHVKQLGTVQLVYPSANHTRFEHSLGVYHLASRALDHLGIEGARADRIEAAAMLHDVGHGPFSHNLEPLTHRRTGKYHDDVDELLATGAVGAVLRDHDLDPDRIAGLVAGEGPYGGLVSGELDVDRMDYLVRDAYHTGVPYGTIDTERFVRELTFVDDGTGDDTLVLDEGNVQTAESLLLARALMNPVVYTHHVARISKAMLRRAATDLLDATPTTAAELRRMDDHDFLAAIRCCPETAELSRRYDERDLYKLAVWAEYDDVPERVHEAGHDAETALEREIAEEAGVARQHVILDVPPEPSMRESTARVTVNGEVRRLERQSPLVSALRTAQRNQWRLGVYAPRPATDRVGRAAADVLGLDPDGLVAEVRGAMPTTLDEFRGGT
ncbi:metal dependent phosphohydrolase [Halorubrum saccharovorum DSM 1137]|uniref:Metal dependent phosphohydrolase n=1 Tax=Halorubrum saccharovorum DSM 1137 TaxID=1227484 RepID=M0E8R7_9EURY|nr:HD domain-containing protein [Halorubrum saccharovorum]ELZ42779.1 metal dependent phosphohydrolase [Halorubrum saccharovorum DSM 1137]